MQRIFHIIHGTGFTETLSDEFAARYNFAAVIPVNHERDIFFHNSEKNQGKHKQWENEKKIGLPLLPNFTES